MNTRVITLLAALAAFIAGPAFAVEVERTVDADADAMVRVSNTAGSIEISGWSRSQVAVSADLGADVEELVVESSGREVLIKVETPRSGRNRNISSDLVIRVPEGVSLDVAAVSADIEIRDVRGEQRLHSVSGDVTTEAFESDVQVEVVSGDVELQGDRKPIRVKLNAVSGDIDAVGLAGEIQAETVSGDLTIAESVFQRVRANTVNGDLVFRAGVEDGGRFDFETVNGDVDINFAGAIEARYDIESFNGGIRNCFGPEPVRTSRYAPGRELKFTDGSGNTRVVIRTLNGDLRLCKD